MATHLPPLYSPVANSGSNFEVGQRVRARFEGRLRWFPGTVRAANADGTYAIDYDDGDAEDAVQAAHIKCAQPAVEACAAQRETAGQATVAAPMSMAATAATAAAAAPAAYVSSCLRHALERSAELVRVTTRPSPTPAGAIRPSGCTRSRPPPPQQTERLPTCPPDRSTAAPPLSRTTHPAAAATRRPSAATSSQAHAPPATVLVADDELPRVTLPFSRGGDKKRGREPLTEPVPHAAVAAGGAAGGERPSGEPPGWECPCCTLHNEPWRKKCSVCLHLHVKVPRLQPGMLCELTSSFGFSVAPSWSEADAEELTGKAKGARLRGEDAI